MNVIFLLSHCSNLPYLPFVVKFVKYEKVLPFLIVDYTPYFRFKMHVAASAESSHL